MRHSYRSRFVHRQVRFRVETLQVATVLKNENDCDMLSCLDILTLERTGTEMRFNPSCNLQIV